MFPTMDHMVLTRFNVQIDARRESPSDAWLTHRLDLFRRFCLPAMASQSCSRFRWLVFFDEASPPWFREDVVALAHARFEPIWTRAVFTPTLASAEVARRHEGTHLITSRLDNDDAVARDYIEAVQSQFARQPLEFINFPHGVQLANGRLYRRSDPSNAFISLIETVQGGAPRTVYLDQHDRLNQHGPIRQVKTDIMWLQVVHDRNLVNRARGLRTTPTNLHSRFAVEAWLETPSKLAVLADRAKFVTNMTIRIVCRPRRLRWLWRVVRPNRL